MQNADIETLWLIQSIADIAHPKLEYIEAMFETAEEFLLEEISLKKEEFYDI